MARAAACGRLRALGLSVKLGDRSVRRCRVRLASLREGGQDDDAPVYAGMRFAVHAPVLPVTASRDRCQLRRVLVWMLEGVLPDVLVEDRLSTRFSGWQIRVKRVAEAPAMA